MNGQPDFALRARARMAALALGGVFALAVPTASAVSFETEDVKGSFDSTVSFGLQWRMSGTSCRIIGNDNGGCAPTTGKLGEVVNGPGFGATSDPDFNYLQSDNGNLNYRKNQLVSSVLKGNHELALRFRDGWSALGRFSWLYDPAADNTERTPLSDGAKNISVHNITLLDLWLAKDLELGDRPAKIKVGNQVLSWGEDIFIYGGINIINPIDLTRAHKPGVQLKEIFRPAPMASFNFGATANLSIEGFWQANWNAFRFDPVGTYFSGADVVGKGQQQAFVPSSVLGAPPGTVGDIGTISNGTFIPAGQRFTLNDLLAIGTVVPALPTQNPAERQPVRPGGPLQAGQRERRVGPLLPALQRQDPVRGLRQRSRDHRQSVRARLLPAVRQGPQPVRRLGQRQRRRLGGRRRDQLPAQGRRGHRPDGAAVGSVLRVLRRRHVSRLRQRQ